jgi:hypothetical protein
MKQITAFLILCFLGQTTHAADVLFLCNTERDYIHVEDETYTKLIPAFGNHEVISTEDITIIDGEDRAAYRKGTKPIVKHCRLTSDNYVVTFDAHWINANLDGLDGGDSWVTVEIKNQKDTVLSRTVIGRCDNNSPGKSGCKDKWAVEVWLSHKHLSLTRLVNEALPHP